MKLTEICNMKIPTFAKFGDKIDNPNGELIFQDNGSKILGVAHLDSVMYNKPEVKNNCICCPQLDDRLGVWTLLNLKEKIDILLTDCEEMGKSTGEYFIPPRQYNWIFSFDRSGVDAVTYFYSDREWDFKVNKYFPVGLGTYSDITTMDLGCKGLNIGIGYHFAHTRKCFADNKDISKQISRFSQFFHENAETYFEHENNLFQPDMCDRCYEQLETRWSYCPFCGGGN